MKAINYSRSDQENNTSQISNILGNDKLIDENISSLFKVGYEKNKDV